jgi:uncharacterized Ntn-hydrolase superfamily protein
MLRLTVLLTLLSAPVLAAEPGLPSVPRRPVNTYSIVARDAQTGELGVAVQSHWFSVGAVVPWAEAGVGAVATQSFVDPSYGKLGLDLMRAGRSGPEALAGLLAADPGREVRQVAMIDAQGRVAAHTGAKNIVAAGHVVGEGFSVQANMMEKDTVWPAMAKAFRESKGDLAERMLAALEAAEAQGGDIRGKQSAALIVVSGKPTGRAWADRRFDLRVEDHPEPLKELRRLVTLQRAYNLMNEGDLAIERNDTEGALKAYAGAEALAPNSAEMVFWHAVSLVNVGRVDEALPLLERTYKLDARWRELLKRLPKAGLLPDDPKLMDRLTGGTATPPKGRAR